MRTPEQAIEEWLKNPEKAINEWADSFNKPTEEWLRSFDKPLEEWLRKQPDGEKAIELARAALKAAQEQRAEAEQEAKA